MTVENKTIGLGQETIFDFKHVPQIGLGTSLGDIGAKQVAGHQERRSIVTLAVATVLAGSLAWLGLRFGLRSAGVGVGGMLGW